jgi:ribosome-binding ATPase YchF (GTP1/OBG family)
MSILARLGVKLALDSSEFKAGLEDATKNTKQFEANQKKAFKNAQNAASAIHTDISDNFITAEVINWQVLINNGGWNNCKTMGLIHNEGKTYIVQDGDIIVFKHGTRKK